MTRSLRARHRRATLALAIALPLAVAVSLAARPPRPNEPLPGPLAASAPALARVVWQGVFGDSTLRVRAALGSARSPEDRDDSSAAAEDRGRLLEIEARSDTAIPELLVYWASAEPRGAALPPEASLLGALAASAPTRLHLPATAAAPGHLMLYDLAHARVAASTRVVLPPPGAAAR